VLSCASGEDGLELRPYPFGALVRRASRELETKGSLFDLPRRRFVLGRSGRDLSVAFHGRRVPTPYGPAAGPHAQLAQNVALAWAGGARIIELKTVQVRDDLAIPRPCIDMQTVGYNVEWSQELRLEQSLEEYVKASMLVRILAESGSMPMPERFAAPVYDMSVGYDFGGITGERVQAFIDGMQDASSLIDRLRGEIPEEWRRSRDLDFSPCISDTLTLSTFHGCPPDEIERIVEFLLQRCGLHVIVKLNPTLLGRDEVSRLLQRMGYDEIRVPPAAFERDTTWGEMTGFVDRLGRLAASVGRGFGVKLTNTLVVENHRSFFPASEREMYLSGPPLHVLAVELLRRFRREFGDRFPISFSAGIDRGNFHDVVALGLVPVTVCSDLLKPGGYGRAFGYFQALEERMAAVGARDLDEWIVRGHGQGLSALESLGLEAGAHSRCASALAAGEPLRDAAGDVLFARWRAAAVLLNTAHYADSVVENARYRRDATDKPPKKIGRHLKLLDCLTCDKCIPVCPNDANFTFAVPVGEYPIVRLHRRGGEWVQEDAGVFAVGEKHQIGVFLDFCNACGNCDVFCPEDGGPYAVKPHFFGSEAAWRASASLDGFYVAGHPGAFTLLARLEGQDFQLVTEGPRATFHGPGFGVHLDVSAPASTIDGQADEGAVVDLGRLTLCALLARSVLSTDQVNYVNCLAPGPPGPGT
jgi:putative selenate reductase